MTRMTRIYADKIKINIRVNLPNPSREAYSSAFYFPKKIGSKPNVWLASVPVKGEKL
jgi:hypothetical protein